jgi:gliding motility-associated-like protein
MHRRPAQLYCVFFRLIGLALAFLLGMGGEQVLGQAIPPPDLVISTTPATCGNPNGTITIQANFGTGPYQYSMDGGGRYQGTNSFTVAGGTYPILVVDANGNQRTGSATVGNIDGPSLLLMARGASCENNDGSITAFVSGGTFPFTFSRDGATWQTSSTVGGLPYGDETVYVMDGNGCVVSDDTYVPLSDDMTFQTGPDITICEGKSQALAIQSNADTYSWFPTDGLNNPALQDPVASPSASTTYFVTATRGVCNRSGSIAVNVNPAPVADAGDDFTICYGKAIELHGSATVAGGGAATGITYTWAPAVGLNNPGLPDPTIVQPVATTYYSLNVTDANGCSALKTDSVLVTVPPRPLLFAGDDTVIAVGQQLQLHATDVDTSGFTAYAWTPAENLDNGFSQSPLATFTVPAVYTYIVTGITGDGCEGVDTVVIRAFSASDIYVPNAFTPNQDGHNDVLHAIATGMKEFKYFTIYNRYGALVFATTNPGIGWDGTRNGRVLEPGTYVWMAAGVDASGRLVERKGTVILIR